MTQPLRLTAIVAVLLVSGFTAEHLASQDRPDRPLPSPSEISRAALEEATGPTDALLTPAVEPGSIGGNARAIGAASEPIFAQYLLNTNVGLAEAQQ